MSRPSSPWFELSTEDLAAELAAISEKRETHRGVHFRRCGKPVTAKTSSPYPLSSLVPGMENWEHWAKTAYANTKCPWSIKQTASEETIPPLPGHYKNSIKVPHLWSTPFVYILNLKKLTPVSPFRRSDWDIHVARNCTPAHYINSKKQPMWVSVSNVLGYRASLCFC